MVYAVLIVILVICLLTGCGILHKASPTEEVWKKLNIDSIHFKSCGPVALEQLHKHYGEEVDNRRVSIHLQKHRKIKIFRILGLINTKFRQITCPPRTSCIFKKKQFRVRKNKVYRFTRRRFCNYIIKRI